MSLKGELAQMVERSLSMREVPGFSIFFFPVYLYIYFFLRLHCRLSK